MDKAQNFRVEEKGWKETKGQLEKDMKDDEMENNVKKKKGGRSNHRRLVS